MGDISIPKIIGIVPLNSFKYGSVRRFREQNGSLYQFTVGNHAKDSLSKIKIKYISEKLAIDVNIKLSELVKIFMSFCKLKFEIKYFFQNIKIYYIIIFAVYIFNLGYL